MLLHLPMLEIVEDYHAEWGANCLALRCPAVDPGYARRFAEHRHDSSPQAQLLPCSEADTHWGRKKSVNAEGVDGLSAGPKPPYAFFELGSFLCFKS